MNRKTWIIVGSVLMFVIGLAALFGESPDEIEEKAGPTAGSQQSTNDLADEFGCQWIMDTYRPMSTLGRDVGIMHLSNAMNLKKGVGVLSYVSTGDAAVALRTCESRGYR